MLAKTDVDPELLAVTKTLIEATAKKPFNLATYGLPQKFCNTTTEI
jgi:hypothetical protein